MGEIIEIIGGFLSEVTTLVVSSTPFQIARVGATVNSVYNGALGIKRKVFFKETGIFC